VLGNNQKKKIKQDFKIDKEFMQGQSASKNICAKAKKIVHKLGGKAFQPIRFSERFLRKNGIEKNCYFCFLLYGVLKLGLFTNYNMLFPFLDIIFTTLEDLGETRSRDLLVGVAHCCKTCKVSFDIMTVYVLFNKLPFAREFKWSINYATGQSRANFKSQNKKIKNKKN